MRLDEVIEFEQHPVVMLAGIQNSGKSYLMREIMRNISWQYHEIIVLTGTEFNRDLIDSLNHPRVRLMGFSHYNPETRKIEDRGEELLETIIGNLHNLKTNGIQWSTLLVLDDWVGSIAPTSKSLALLARASRHYGITMLISAQKLKSMTSTFLRSACGYLLVFGNLPQPELQGITEYITNEYYSQNPSAFIHDIRKILTRPYEFCLIDRRLNQVNFFHPIENELELTQKRLPDLRARINSSFM